TVQQTPVGPVACNPPCPAGTTCSADGRRCESATAQTAPTSLTDEQIAEALDRIRRRVLRCRRREDGDATVTVEVEIEPAGSVSSVRIDGPIANSDAGACIEQAVFRATFPTFQGDNRVVRHSFVPSP
ncbi:MAG: TonB C-terminal domain-containing protein, partial [Deltaproteobacteria bacterium]|nr:TonB C-terminal domain-containing protein [Deltaproteobacteria bacterium]